MKEFIRRIPIIGRISRSIYRKWICPEQPFTGSEDYWKERYDSGGNSGDGSSGRLAEFKAEILNQFVKEQGIQTIIEFGCGDGNQLALADYPLYTGYDVSPKAIALCREKFSDDTSKAFRLLNEYTGEKAQVTLSLDVIFHLIEDNVFCDYMNRLFDSAEEFVIIYSSNTSKNENQAPHVKHRLFTEWVERRRPEWKLRSRIPNRFPFCGNTRKGSFADFYIFERV